MNYNRKRHKLLKELSRLITNREENRNDFDCNEVSMSFKQIDKFLNVTRKEREIILSDLWKSNEIILCEIPINDKGCYINDSVGISSFSNNKYIYKIIFKIFKYLGFISATIYLLITIYDFIYKNK